MHRSAVGRRPKPYAKVNADSCRTCGCCVRACAVGALTLGKDAAEVATEHCIGCARCVHSCPFNAITLIRE